MTSLAVLEPPLRRLFERIDFAPQPRSERLKAILDLWTAKRRGHIAPSPEATEAAWSGKGAFHFAYDASKHKYELAEGAESVRPLLGELKRGQDLATSGSRRAAVRLRRLFDAVRGAGEPILAEFTDVRSGLFTEILIAPLSTDDRHVDSMLGALAMRPSGAHMRHPAHPKDAREGPLLFALSDNYPLASRMAAYLGIQLSPHEFRKFEDGEHKARPLISVRDRDVYVLAGLWGGVEESVNDKLCRLLFFVGCLRDAAAARITAVVPYFGYARKDRKTKPRDPVTMRYVAQLFEAVAVDRVVALEIHSVAAYQNAFRCVTEHLDASALFADELVRLAGNDVLTVVSPDLGGGKRADQLHERLEAVLGREVGKAFMEKHRSLGVVTGELFAGEVRGHTAVIIDDLISSGTTMARCARACHERGATRIFLAATHGLFTSLSSKVLSEPFISGIIVTDTVPQYIGSPVGLPPKLSVLSVGELLGEAVRRMHAGEPLTGMLTQASCAALHGRSVDGGSGGARETKIASK